MNYNTLFKTAVLAGEIMAQSGSETFRVEDTMTRILRTSGLQVAEVYVTPTGFMATLSDPKIQPITEVLRINNRFSDLGRINEVNQISRDLCELRISIDEAYDRLIKIRSKVTYSKLVILIATIVSTGGFTGLFGGSFLDCFIAAVNGLMIVLIGQILLMKVDSTFMIVTVKSFFIAFFTMVFTISLKHAGPDIIIIGSIMPLVPGLPITNAIRDTLTGDYMSGTARAVEAFVISAGIAFGIGFGMGFFNLLERMLGL
jgi:uncharacterized membrane protein YjjP (DUF1212 family)